MPLTRFTSPHDFNARVEAYLLQQEVHHNLMLGLSASLMYNPTLYGSALYLAVVEEAGQVVAAALMTPPHRVTVALTNSYDALRAIVRDVHDFRPDTPGVSGPAPVSQRFAEMWSELTGRPFHRHIAERVYRLDTVTPPTNVSGQMRRVTDADRDLLTTWIYDFRREALGEDNRALAERTVHNMLTLPPEYRGTFLWEDPHPVSLVSYGGPTPNSMRLGPVYTPKAFRGRGYASACTAAVSQYLLDSGRKFVTLFTDLGNPTSNKIYMQIGYLAVTDVDVYDFGAG